MAYQHLINPTELFENSTLAGSKVKERLKLISESFVIHTQNYHYKEMVLFEMHFLIKLVFELFVSNPSLLRDDYSSCGLWHRC